MPFDIAGLHREVRALYTRVAEAPTGNFHFHRGPAYASGKLGYDAHALAALPAEVTASFAGVGNPHAAAPIPVGATVLDVGCGAGTDTLLAADAVGPGGRAIGVDFTAAMLAVARRASADRPQVEILEGEATALPVPDASVDVVISNGVLNLVPDKLTAFAEIARVLRPGGRLQLADIVVGRELSEGVRGDIDLWAA